MWIVAICIFVFCAFCYLFYVVGKEIGVKEQNEERLDNIRRADIVIHTSGKRFDELYGKKNR